MKFRGIRRYQGSNITSLANFLVTEFGNWVGEFVNGLSKLNFEDNIEGYLGKATIEAGGLYKMTHNLGYIPSKRIIVKQVGNGLIEDSSLPWTTTAAFFTNNGAVPVYIEVLLTR